MGIGDTAYNFWLGKNKKQKVADEVQQNLDSAFRERLHNAQIHPESGVPYKPVLDPSKAQPTNDLLHNKRLLIAGLSPTKEPAIPDYENEHQTFLSEHANKPIAPATATGGGSMTPIEYANNSPIAGGFPEGSVGRTLSKTDKSQPWIGKHGIVTKLTEAAKAYAMGGRNYFGMKAQQEEAEKNRQERGAERQATIKGQAAGIQARLSEEDKRLAQQLDENAKNRESREYVAHIVAGKSKKKSAIDKLTEALEK